MKPSLSDRNAARSAAQAEVRRLQRLNAETLPPPDAEDVHAESMREQVLARAARSRPQPKPQKPSRSARYLDFIREQPCMCCEKDGPNHAHHHAPEGHRAIGERCDDRFAVPLCSTDGLGRIGCHEFFHAHGKLPNRHPDRTEFAPTRDSTNEAIEREQGRLLVLAVTRGIL